MTDWLTLREIDEAERAPKGSAFRAFKALESRLQENRDFRLLLADAHAGEIAALGKRAYASSRNVLVFSQATAALLREKMR